MNISNFEKIICITDFILEKSINNHSNCKFTSEIKSEDSSEFSSLVGKTVTISHEGHNIFFGIVKKIEIFNKISSCYMETDIISVSSVIDMDLHTRIFQNPKKKLSDIIKAIEFKSAKMYQRCVSSNHSINLVDIGSSMVDFPVVQYNETDFNFLSRLAKFFECSLWIDDISSNNFNIYFGKNSSKKKVSINKDDVISYKKINSLDGNTCIIEMVKLKDIFELGINSTFEDVTGIITALNVTLKNNIYSFNYTISEKIDYDKPSILWQNQPLNFNAKVVNNDDTQKLGRVQVSFKEDKKVDDELLSDDKFWIDVKQINSQNAGGFIFIPNKDDLVNVNFYQDSFFVENIIRQDKFSQNLDNCNHRYIFNIYDKSICLTEENIKINSKENSITLSDKDMLIKVGKYQALIDSDEAQLDVGKSKISVLNDSIEISLGNVKIKISADSIILNVGNSKINISNDFEISTDNISFKTKSNFKADAKKITLKGSNGIGMN